MVRDSAGCKVQLLPVTLSIRHRIASLITLGDQTISPSLESCSRSFSALGTFLPVSAFEALMIIAFWWTSHFSHFSQIPVVFETRNLAPPQSHFWITQNHLFPVRPDKEGKKLHSEVQCISRALNRERVSCLSIRYRCEFPFFRSQTLRVPSPRAAFKLLSALRTRGAITVTRQTTLRSNYASRHQPDPIEATEGIQSLPPPTQPG